MKNNKVYFPCCRSKSISEENLHEDTLGARVPNPIIVGIANHLREHHSSARNSAIAGCFGFSDSPPKYEDIYAVNPKGLQNRGGGGCNVDGVKAVLTEEESSASNEEEIPPPSYKESVAMAAVCVMVNVVAE